MLSLALFPVESATDDQATSTVGAEACRVPFLAESSRLGNALVEQDSGQTTLIRGVVAEGHVIHGGSNFVSRGHSGVRPLQRQAKEYNG